MKALVFVRPGDDVTLPQEIMEAAGIEEGDAVTFSVTGLGSVEIKVLPLPPIEDVLERDISDETIDGTPRSEATEGARARERDDPPVLTLAELLERYRIDWPPDDTAKRNAYLATTSEETFGLPRLTLEEALHQFRIEGPIDGSTERATVSEEMARTKLGD